MSVEPQRRWAAIRIALGQAQIVGAVVSLGCLVSTGMSSLTAWAVSITAMCLTASLLLFAKGDRER